MGYMTKFDGSTDKTISLGTEGNPKAIEGYFLGSKDVKSDYGPAKLHIFNTNEGTIGVWGKTRMNNLLTDDHRGQMVLLQFTGMIAPTKKGRRPSYGFKLQYDPANTIDVSSIDLNASPAPDADESEGEAYSAADATYRTKREADVEDFGYNGPDESEAEEYTPPAPVAPRVAATVPDADRKARMQALLNRKK